MKASSLRVALPLFLMASASLWAHGRPSPITPGHYTNWGGQIDKLEIVATFKVADYSRIVVQPFDTSSAPLPKEGDSAYDSVQKALSETTPTLATALSAALPKIPVQVEAAGTSPTSGALVVRGKVLRMDPGVKAPVYPANGTGRARTVIEAEVVDGTTGKTLLRFRQERRIQCSRRCGRTAPSLTTSDRAGQVEGVTEEHQVREVHRRHSFAPLEGETALDHNLRLAQRGCGGHPRELLDRPP